jgi:hypothetical protein
MSGDTFGNIKIYENTRIERIREGSTRIGQAGDRKRVLWIFKCEQEMVVAASGHLPADFGAAGLPFRNRVRALCLQPLLSYGRKRRNRFVRGSTGVDRGDIICAGAAK